MNLTRIVKTVLKTTKTFTKLHSAELLSAVACAGVVLTAVSAEQAGRNQADNQLDRDYRIKFETNTPVEDIKKEYIKQTIVNYSKPALLGSLTILSIIGSNKIHLSNKAAILAAYELSKDELIDLKGAIKNKLTDKQQETINDEYHKIADKRKVDETIIETGEGSYLYRESMTGVFFRSSDDAIQKAVNKFNHYINNSFDGYYGSLNDFVYYLKLDNSKSGNILGWNNEDLGPYGLEVSTSEYQGKHPKTGEAYCELTYSLDPYANYAK